MGEQPSYDNFIVGIRTALERRSPSQNIDFVCRTIEAFERELGDENWDATQGMLNEAVEMFGAGTSSFCEKRLFPIYKLLAKYSEVEQAPTIFENLFEKGFYLRSALFYVEWSRSLRRCENINKAKAVLNEGIRQNAEPRSELIGSLTLIDNVLFNKDQELRRVRGVSESSDDWVEPQRRGRGTKRTLFAELSAMQSPNATNFEIVDENIENSPDDERPPQNFVVEDDDTAESSFDVEENYDSDDVDSENRKPEGYQPEGAPRRRTMGILVPSVGFELEDYDFYKADLEKEAQDARAEANKNNIKNNSNPAVRNLSALFGEPSTSAASASPRRDLSVLGSIQDDPNFRPVHQAINYSGSDGESSMSPRKQARHHHLHHPADFVMPRSTSPSTTSSRQPLAPRSKPTPSSRRAGGELEAAIARLSLDYPQLP